MLSRKLTVFGNQKRCTFPLCSRWAFKGGLCREHDRIANQQHPEEQLPAPKPSVTSPKPKTAPQTAPRKSKAAPVPAKPSKAPSSTSMAPPTVAAAAPEPPADSKATEVDQSMCIVFRVVAVRLGDP